MEHFASNSYNIRQDYGRAATSRAQQFRGGFQWMLPRDVQITPFLVARSGAPFDITTGTDLNGDTIYNDRPAFATDPARTTAVPTAFGTFDIAPVTGQAPVPRNYGTSPGFVWLQLRAGKDFHLGPRPKANAVSGSKPGPPADRPWDLNIGVEVHNLTNHNNPGLPVGAIAATPCALASSGGCGCLPGQSACGLVPSPYFGHSLSIANDFSPNTASNRTILLQSSFTF